MDIEVLVDDEKISEICRQYWQVDEEGSFKKTVTQIAKEYGQTSYEITQTAKEYCIARSDVTLCSSCEEKYVYSSRQDYNSKKNYTCEWECNECIEFNQFLVNEEKKKRLTIALAESTESPINLESLTARQAVFLLALIRHSATEDLSLIDNISSAQTERLSPKEEYSIDLVRELYQADLIAINPITDLDMIELGDDNNFSFYITEVKWHLPLPKNISHPRVFIELLEEKISSMEYLDNDYEEVVELCKEISVMECICYLESILAEHQLNFSPGEKTHAVLNKALESFSVSQVYNFIWRAAKDAAAFYMRAQVSKKHAANTVVSNIEKSVEKTLTNNWSVKGYNRNYNIPQSNVSRVLFNSLLHTDDGGFNQPLSQIV